MKSKKTSPASRHDGGNQTDKKNRGGSFLNSKERKRRTEKENAYGGDRPPKNHPPRGKDRFDSANRLVGAAWTLILGGGTQGATNSWEKEIGKRSH